jgi:hypothetical protein
VTAEWGYGKTEAPLGAESLPRKRGGTGDYKGAALMSFLKILLIKIVNQIDFVSIS